MKICMLTSTYPSSMSDSGAKFVHEMAREIVNLGHEVHVLAPYKSTSKKDYVMDGVKIKRFNYFFPKKLQKLCEGAGIPANINKGIIVKSQIITLTIAAIIKAEGAEIVILKPA